MLQLMNLMIVWYTMGIVTVSVFTDCVVQDGDCYY
jgi:hypothetical protein